MALQMQTMSAKLRSLLLTICTLRVKVLHAHRFYAAGPCFVKLELGDQALTTPMQTPSPTGTVMWNAEGTLRAHGVGRQRKRPAQPLRVHLCRDGDVVAHAEISLIKLRCEMQTDAL